MSALGITTTQETLIAVGLAGVAAAIIYYEVEKGNGKGGDSWADDPCGPPPSLSPGSWFDPTGQAARVAAYAACEKKRHIEPLDGKIKVGIFQGTYQIKVKDDGSGWNFDCSQPIISYNQYGYDEIADLKKKYAGKENYLIFTDADAAWWKTYCNDVGGVIDKFKGDIAEVAKRIAAINDALNTEFKAAITSMHGFPFTEQYIRAKCAAGQISGAAVDNIVTEFMSLQPVYNTLMTQSRRKKLFEQFQKRVDKVKVATAAASHRGANWPPYDGVNNLVIGLDPTNSAELINDEVEYVGAAQGYLNALHPPRADQDAWLASLLASWKSTVDAAKSTKNWPTQPSVVDFMNQGCDDAHSASGYIISSTYLNAAKTGTK